MLRFADRFLDHRFVTESIDPSRRRAVDILVLPFTAHGRVAVHCTRYQSRQRHGRLRPIVYGFHRFHLAAGRRSFTNADPILIDVAAAARVPEPATCVLLGVALLIPALAMVNHLNVSSGKPAYESGSQDYGVAASVPAPAVCR